ncbi:chemotaxis protein CheW [bacterium DOLZORAL124_64_63]|nr:MAG: chemotaxis protein CheW [bacterium DOLZORAL124_64_63]
MTFGIDGQDYGIEILNVTEIVGLQDIAEVPDVPNFVKGMMNLRGNVVPVISVRLRFGLPEVEYDDRTCVVVITLGNSTIGMIVDRVNEVRTIPEANISTPPQGGVAAAGGQFITGLGRETDSVTILLDLAALLDIKDEANPH